MIISASMGLPPGFEAVLVTLGGHVTPDSAGGVGDPFARRAEQDGDGMKLDNDGRLLVQYLDDDVPAVVLLDQSIGAEATISLQEAGELVPQVSALRGAGDGSQPLTVRGIQIPETSFDRLVYAIGYFIGTAAAAGRR